MDLAYTEEHELIRKTAREFAQERLAPGVAERDRDMIYPEEQLRELGELGFWGIFFDEKYGGAGLDSISYCIAIEELSRVDASVGVIISVTNSLAAYPIDKFGTEEQKQKFLAPLVSGQKLGGFCLTEPGAGSDAGAQKTTAVVDGDNYVVNGSKHFVTSGKNGDIFIVTAVTDKSQGLKGTSTLIIEQGTPGLTVEPPEHKLGIRGSDTHALTFDDCKVPVANRLGAEGDGFKVAMTALDSGRMGIAAQALGIAQGSLDASLQYAHERQQFGKFLKDFQAIQFKLADMETRIHASRLLLHQSALLKDAGKRYTKEVAMAKVFCSETAMWAAEEAVQIYGGYGYSTEYPVERFMRDAKITEIYEGTSEIQRVVIAANLLAEWAKMHG
ncbi:acyl-CoA dehydrogenase [candidate division LCP-89 bacterium B3_LCP]|uniref:Cyclohexane-1-carbonyl-CoA dehydrogenase n=1 Tax=candidate division LCP-89 bacterium B3_LCP TaxID=2012998 RepID=A0A532V2Z9_UNCL8|nr:MAG: acyl-CoA dehydrogenase [candidate division LCP-89 bacterium B3_LCP]